MKVAITGGAGFIGSHLAKTYLDAGHDVLVIDNLARGMRQAVDARARFYQMDIRDTHLRSLLQQERPDILSHHAAQYEHEVSMLDEPTLADADVHVRGLLNILDSCIQASVSKFIYASGGNTLYGCVDASQLPLNEDAALNPQRPHDISKLAGEWYVRYYTHRFGLRHTILRYANVYGHADNLQSDHPVHYFIRTLLQGQHPVIRGASDEARDHIFIDDVVRANLAVLEHGDNQTFNISSGCGYSLDQLYDMVTGYLESPIAPTYISGTLTHANIVVLDNTRARQLLGWRPEVSMAEGIWRAGGYLHQAAEPVTQTLPAIEKTPTTGALGVTHTLVRV